MRPLVAGAVVGLGLVAAGVYWLTAPSNTPAVAVDYSTLEELREGTMKKLVFHSEPKPVSGEIFYDLDDGQLSLADLKGKYTVLNFWATWCAPCRHEMPSLDDLAAEFNSDAFQVTTIATGRNPIPALKKFFKEEDITNLPLYRDPKQGLARDMAVLGLPITVVINPEGQEIARLRGDAEWYSDSARSIVKALIAQ